jgi:hypothetical protein
MKVLEKALWPPPWSKLVVCGTCKSKLEVCFSDLFRPSAKADRYDYRCPVCSEWNCVPYTDVPEKAYSAAKEKPE